MENINIKIYVHGNVLIQKHVLASNKQAGDYRQQQCSSMVNRAYVKDCQKKAC